MERGMRMGVIAGMLLLSTQTAMASYEIDLNNGNTLKFGGYLKVDGRYVDGEVNYLDFWRGNGGGFVNGNTLAQDKAQQFKIFANESRFNTTYTHKNVSAFVEIDFFLGPGGNQVISNSYNPRLRHAFIQYQSWLVGQTWTTFMNTSAIPETADFAGGNAGLAFVRQGMVRFRHDFSHGNIQLALENPETTVGGSSSTDNQNDDVPDVIAKYTATGRWGNVNFSLLGRQLHYVNDNNSETDRDFAVGYALAGQLKTFGKDDVRFQLNLGDTGRYTTLGLVQDVYNNQAQQSTGYMLAYRHYWTETLRSTVLYAGAKADTSNDKVQQWTANLFKNLTPALSIGIEVGNFQFKQGSTGVEGNSYYGQATMKFIL